MAEISYSDYEKRSVSFKEEMIVWIYELIYTYAWDKNSKFVYSVYSTKKLNDEEIKKFLSQYANSSLKLVMTQNAKPVITERYSSSNKRLLGFKNVETFTTNGKDYSVHIPKNWKAEFNEKCINKEKNLFILSLAN